MSFLDHLDELRRRLLYSTVRSALPAARSRSSTGIDCTSTTSGYFGRSATATTDRLHQADGRVHVQPEDLGAGGAHRRGAVSFFAGWLFVAPGIVRTREAGGGAVRLLLVDSCSSSARTSRTWSHSLRCGGSSRVTPSAGSVSCRRSTRPFRSTSRRSSGSVSCFRCRCWCSFSHGSASSRQGSSSARSSTRCSSSSWWPRSSRRAVIRVTLAVFSAPMLVLVCRQYRRGVAVPEETTAGRLSLLR